MKKCKQCKVVIPSKDFKYPSWQKNYDKKVYCTPVCARQAGLVRSWKENREFRIKAIKDVFEGPRGEEIKRKMAEWQQGSKARQWKGDKATYNSKHRWIQNNWNRSGRCEFCKGKPPPRKGGVSGTEWANISNAYDRDNRSDWFELCSSCHKIFDKTKKVLESL